MKIVIKCFCAQVFSLFRNLLNSVDNKMYTVKKQVIYSVYSQCYLTI